MQTLLGHDMQIELPMGVIAEFCHKWKIEKLEVFGSVLRDDFDPEKSDVGFLVIFEPDDGWSLFDFGEMREELSEMLGREVDWVERKCVENSENWILREHILTTVEPIYVAS